MVPGPVKVPAEVLEQYGIDYGSADLERDYVELYDRTEANLQQIMGTQNSIAIQTGEGMLALWAALKSCLQRGNRVLSIATGLFGFGIGDMARSIGAHVKIVGLPYNQTLTDWEAIEKEIIAFQPKMITAVHCETPSGTLNPLEQLGRLKKEYGIPLLYVDAVSSIGGAPVLVDEWHIDLALGGAQKCLSVPPGMTFLSVSPQAWEIIDQVNYVGYEALKPYKTAREEFYFPYTPYWHGMAALHAGTELILQEGLQNCFKRHQDVAAYCYKRLAEIGLTLYPASNAVLSPTVSAVNVPENFTWEELDSRFRQRGLVVGGNYGPLAGKVFRLGHMGSQADRKLMKQALDVIASVVKPRKKRS
ncbi:MAG: alanine--glyoxylate aminotransferase family protein [Chloroflexi bacterium]|nr:alanine--glyoxylate aminotransferase family protein [Chloroflexota bacterium]